MIKSLKTCITVYQGETRQLKSGKSLSAPSVFWHRPPSEQPLRQFFLLLTAKALSPKERGNTVSCPLTDSLAAAPAAGSKKRKQSGPGWGTQVRREGHLTGEVGKGLRGGGTGTELGFKSNTGFPGGVESRAKVEQRKESGTETEAAGEGLG